MVKIHSFVYYEHLIDDYVIEHKHDSHECIFFVSGKAKISTQNVAYTISSPAIAMVPPSVPHDEQEVTSTKMYIVLFSYSEELSNDVEIISLNPEQHEKIKNMFEEMYELEKNKDNLESRKQQRSLFSLVLSLLQAFKYMQKDDSAQIGLVNFSKKYIEKNYQYNINYAAIADSYGYSYSRFRHIFKEQTRMSPHQYCLSLRLINAKKLLKETNLTVRSISKKCGFSQPITFVSFFKKEMNISPLKFRALVRQQDEGAVINIGGGSKYE